MFPELVHAHKWRGFGLWLTQSMLAISVDTISVDNAAEHFSCAATFLIPVLPSEKKILCPCTSVLDLISLDFWINEKAATPHHERQEFFLLLRFAMLCNGFGIQNHVAIRQPKRAA